MGRAVYYNEWDAKKAAWLQQLQIDGHISEGVTDSRDIRDVLPSELMGYERVHFFAGIGGWEYALELAGWSGPVWTASCPCQPFSAAGKRAGLADERHLFPALHWLIDQCKPPIIVGEQVASKDGLAWLDTVFARLENSGYSCAAVDLCAAGVGAPHIRQRLYWVAYTEEERYKFSGNPRERGAGPTDHGANGGVADSCGFSRGRDCDGVFGEERAFDSQRELDGRSYHRHRDGGADRHDRAWSDIEWVRCVDPRDGRETYRPIEPGSMPLAHGVPARMVRISGYGDAIVPQVAAAFLESVREAIHGGRLN